ncbi:iron complex outermembrane recepter protein [Duganella sp. CF402]|uniref:TonB-dependent receptor plug domain-containing protein n=1 Tax=unclassified Duganella TaxID=2636909 RepID=UPI0008B21CCE|nr:MULTISPECIES: TonB-dependent receptor [unclassified Duganella]RZT08940.1 iron complex outermembrane receptor protein [Duganella sp. BK701]SEL76212.1 iron complex outermembrane recepter protein [Duganella sp. CF402]
MRIRPLLLASLISSIVIPAFAQQAADGELQSVVVTGTYAKNRRTVDSESPVDIIGARELQASGSTELATVLGRVLPSLNFPRPSGADASDAVRPAQLRGLSPDQVLVLVNGKRRHASAVVNVNGTQGRGSAPVDLNAIPLSAIDHIEVLRDGAAAQYGSDAIAGVINIILKKGAAGGDAEIGFGEYQERDGKQVSLRGSAGFNLGDNGWVRIAVDAADRDPTNRAGADYRYPTDPRYGQVNQRFGDPETKPRVLFLNSQYRVSDDIDWYAFANYGQRDTSAAATWRSFGRSTIYPEGFLPLENSKSTDTSLVTGLRGEASGWRWDVSLNYGQNEFKLDLDNTVNLDLKEASPTHFYAGKLKSSQSLLNIDVARDYPVEAFTGPLTVALGAEYRREEYEIGAGDVASYSGSGAQGFSGFRAVNAGSNSRHNESVYANFEAEVTKQFSASAALRHERYSDFGNTTSVKGSTRYAFNDAVSLRATASSGFRAPSLAQQFYTITTTNFSVVNGVNTPIETGTFAVGSAAAAALGATPLKAEKARNYSLGLLVQPARNWTASIDAYRIDIDDRIALSANMTLNQALKDTLAKQGLLVGAGRYFTNAIDTRTTGVDVLSTYRWETSGAGRFDFTAAYNHNKNSVEHVNANPAILSANGLTLIDRQTVNRLTAGSPKDKFSLATDWALGDWGTRAVLTRYGKFTVPQNNATLDQTYDPQWVLDLSASVKLGKQWRLSVGVDNATDRYPDQVTSAGNLNNNGINPYSGWAPNGFNGRYYYAKAGFTW